MQTNEHDDGLPRAVWDRKWNCYVLDFGKDEPRQPIVFASDVGLLEELVARLRRRRERMVRAAQAGGSLN